MKEPAVGFQQPVVADRQPSERAQPADRALNDPAPTISSELPPILVRGFRVVHPCRDNGLDASTRQQGPRGIAVIAPIRNQPLRPLARAPRPVRPADNERVKSFVDCFSSVARLPAALGQNCSQQKTPTRSY
jgi:hypothetical protein